MTTSVEQTEPFLNRFIEIIIKNISEIVNFVLPLLSGGLAGSIFTWLISKRRERKIAKLELV